MSEIDPEVIAQAQAAQAAGPGAPAPDPTQGQSTEADTSAEESPAAALQEAPAAPQAPPVPQGPLPPPPADATPAQVQATQDKQLPAEWPYVGYSGAQPWEAENPPALTQNKRMVSAGAAGQEVVELGSYLGALGYRSSITDGGNPHSIYDSSVVNAVEAFCRDYGVAEDPQVKRARTEDTVGPWLWEALVRAVHKQIAEQGS